ncbi:BTAD domain-containing putative transcriptional regulator [Kitasatospora sp. NPDC086791]|uniref:AfsR/SARP family transcriptional regulator n=1 Tax=Kitasatospora sp. NPDC086791 TaxID=3155178 RepID=UPI00343E5522
MHIDLLGPVVVRREDGTAVTPSAPKRRALLCALAVRLNQTVATEELIELVWDGSAPPTARAALQGHVAALRQLLDGPGLVLDTRGSGYLLAGEPDRVDALRFARLCEEAGVLLPGPAAPDGTAPERIAPGQPAPEDPALPLLRAALDLWRGPALTDCGSALLREWSLPHLTDLRLRALERLAEGLLRAGRGGESAAELAAAADAHPSRQTLTARLVHCLEQDGRRAEARERYEHAVARLAGPPGPELRRAGERFDTRPAPPDRRFVGRSAELARLEEALPAARAGRPILVTGPAGVGKTALVRHWAAGPGAGHFPDGLLRADLRGFHPDGPREPADVLGEFLTALGVAPDALPTATAERSRRYRELVSGRRLAILLDDAACYEQLAPLLPDPPAADGGADGPAPVTVVTSRSRLRHLLVREGGVPLPLGPLTSDDAVALLARALGPDRTGDAPDAVAEPSEAVEPAGPTEPTEVSELAELAESCDRLPLALRLAAARLAARPDWSPGDLVRELADEETGLVALSGIGAGTGTGTAAGTGTSAGVGIGAGTVLGPIGLTTALDRTYRTLPPAAARLFTLLGLHPGQVVDTATAAALADLPPAVTRTLLTGLDAVHLLEETVPGHYARRELVRRYAARQAAELSCEERFVTLDRLIAHYLDVTADWTVESTAGCPAGGGSARAADWFRREESALRAVVVCAEQYGRTAGSWRLAHRIALLYETTGHDRTHDRSHWRAVVEAGLSAAHADGNETAVARLGTDLAVLHVARAAHRTAAEHLDLAVAAADRAGDPALRHHCRGRVAAALLRAGRHERALPMLTDLVAAARTPATSHLLVPALTGLADALVLAGDPGPALTHADEAVRAATTRSGAEAVLATHSRARALHALGRRDAALSSARLAVALGRTVGDAALEARSYGLLADLLCEVGRGVEGAEARRRAEALAAGGH